MHMVTQGLGVWLKGIGLALTPSTPHEQDMTIHNCNPSTEKIKERQKFKVILAYIVNGIYTPPTASSPTPTPVIQETLPPTNKVLKSCVRTEQRASEPLYSIMKLMTVFLPITFTIFY